MRGTAFTTNKALSAPLLILGAERELVLVLGSLWLWALGGVMPHWPSLLVIFGMIITIFLLRLVAKRDPLGSKVFKNNSRFLLQHRFYCARGFSMVTSKRKVLSVPVSKISGF